ncbi:MAG: chromate transporter, partial [Pyrinomonadaceae bacterium]|nr:chromate transporter [Pyrinomonadaceae bacterium]
NFLLIGLLAFGGGQAALPLVERVSVAERGWITPDVFSTAVAFGYVTPGPVLITATFVGFQAAGFGGALAATIAVFLFPFLLAALAAGQIQRFASSKWLKAFGKGAAPAVIGLLGVTIMSLGQNAFENSNLGYIFIATGAAALSLFTKIHPIWILLGGVAAGAIIESVG